MRWLYPCDLGLLSERFQASDEVVVHLKALSLKHLSTDEVVVPFCGVRSNFRPMRWLCS